MSPRTQLTLKILLPVSVLVLTGFGVGWIYVKRPRVAARPPAVPPPLVRVLEARRQDLQLTVRSQGTVEPRTETSLVSEVSGRVLRASPSLVSGGFFEDGQILLELDPVDYELAVVQARAQVAEAELRLAREEAEADVARKEWNELGEGQATPLTLREPQLAEAGAAVAAAHASLRRAERDLQRTKIRAPFPGRVREEHVDVGQFVDRGQALASIYAVDYAEVRLPLPDDQLAFLDLPLGFNAHETDEQGPPVVLRARFAGKEHFWEGRVVRTEGEIDPQSRMVQTVARVEDPYGLGAGQDNTPLAAGMFVEGEILGRLLRDVVVLPREALRDADRLLVVEQDDRLFFRRVEVARAERQRVVVSSGLEDGERVCLSPLDAVTDGMKVRVMAEPPPDDLPVLGE